jgi:hypothetical protein
MYLVTGIGLSVGFHRLHHAFPQSARHGVEAGQLDIAADTIAMFERFGWDTDVHWPRRAVMIRLTAHQGLVAKTMRLIGVESETLLAVRLVVGEVPLPPAHL